MSQLATISVNNRQYKVIEALIAGSTMTVAAKAGRVHRSTVHRWLRDDFEFQAALNQLRRVVRHSVDARLTLLGEKAVDVLSNAMDKGDVKAAVAVLKGIDALHTGQRLPPSENPNTLRHSARYYGR